MNARRHPLNAVGDFYVLDGECIACQSPEADAPDLIGHVEENYHCFFRRQPETPEELERAIRAVANGCCGGVRYGGTNSKVLQRLAELRASDACDHKI